MSLLLLVALAVLAPADERPAEAVRLRVLTYNIHHGEGIDGKLDLERIARVIRSVEPDLVSLQELDRGTKRTGGVDQPAELSRLTGMAVVFGGNIKHQGGDYGNAVLSRLPIKRHHNHALTMVGAGEQRGLLEVEIELPDQRRLLFLATHLDHRRDDRERVGSAEEIARLVAQMPQRPALLAGDLNDASGSRVLSAFKETWTFPQQAPLPTVPVINPRRQIDYVLYRPADRWRAIEVRVLDEPVASDHLPLLAVLELIPAEGE